MVVVDEYIQQRKETKMSNDNKPAHRIRLSTVSAAVFKNSNADGKDFFNVQARKGDAALRPLSFPDAYEKENEPSQ